MISLVDGFGDVGRADAVAYLTDKRGTASKRIHIGTVGTLAQGADDSLAWDEHLMAFLILADNTIGRNLLPYIFCMGRRELCPTG